MREPKSRDLPLVDAPEEEGEGRGGGGRLRGRLRGITTAEREGFEPSVGSPPHSLSKRAPSASRSPSLTSAPDRVRTCDPGLRRPVLYPTELLELV